VLAAFAGGLFLLHPVQTESVSYIASRRRLSASSSYWRLLVVFLYRKSNAVGYGTTIAILALFGAAVLTKEHTAVLPLLLLLTDYYWNPGFSIAGIRANWRLYIPIAVAGALGVVLVTRVLSAASTAGFGVKEFTWYQYFFTECRVIWDYLWMFLLPSRTKSGCGRPDFTRHYRPWRHHRHPGALGGDRRSLDLPAPFSAGFLRMVHLPYLDRADIFFRSD